MIFFWLIQVLTKRILRVAPQESTFQGRGTRLLSTFLMRYCNILKNNCEITTDIKIRFYNLKFYYYAMIYISNCSLDSIFYDLIIYHEFIVVYFMYFSVF